MKCQKCEKPATYHITEITDEQPKSLHEVHLCEECVKVYLAETEEGDASGGGSVAGALAHHLKVGQTAEELARLDQLACPVCGITFYEFRQAGRLGCPYDYVCFDEELEPLIVNIHGETHHRGKRPKRGPQSADRQTQLIRLRRSMKDAVEREDYERASQLRDEIRSLEDES
jgi:protein arginine kinase activator